MGVIVVTPMTLAPAAYMVMLAAVLITPVIIAAYMVIEALHSPMQLPLRPYKD